MKIHDSCRFVITCRFAGYTEDARLDADFLEMHLRPMTTEQAETFVRNWYQIVETAHTTDPAQATILANDKATELIERLRQPDFRARRVFELTRNPLLLTNICLVHLSRGNLPHTRAALYDECVEVLLERWRSAAGIQTRISSQIGRTVLQPVAYWLHQQEERTRATAEELAPVIAPVLKTIGWSNWSAKAELSRSKLRFDTPEEGTDEELAVAREFLQTVWDESGLLTGWDQRHYGFMHLGFQEYLAAVEIRNRAYEDPVIWRELAAKFGEPWWQEVILLLLALYNPPVFKPFMREVLKRPGIEAHRDLIEMCLDDAAEKSPQPFLDLLAMEAGQDQEVWQRQLLALQLVAPMNPEAVEQLTPALRQHPSQNIRQWLQARMLHARQNVIYAEPGGYELVFIPGGVFMMGSPETEEGRFDNESPLHEVQVPDFYMGRYPVTNADYGRFLAANPKMEEPEEWGNREFNQPNQPVVGVSWEDAQKYAEWLNELTPNPLSLEKRGGKGVSFRLPTEAEWEYACRAGTTTRYYTGDTEQDLDRAGWYDGNSGGKLHPVGEKEPNAFGLYDMLGNAWEWCEDVWHDNYKSAPTDGSAWLGGGSNRVNRGGSWYGVVRKVRCALRGYDAPSYRGRVLGFRLARIYS